MPPALGWFGLWCPHLAMAAGGILHSAGLGALPAASGPPNMRASPKWRRISLSNVLTPTVGHLSSQLEGEAKHPGKVPTQISSYKGLISAYKSP